MKTALIQCPVWGTYEPPLALAQLSGFLKKYVDQVFVFDLNIGLYHQRSEDYKNMWAWEQCSFWYDFSKVTKFFADNQSAIDQYLKEIIKSEAGIICFSVSSSSWIASLEFARLIKQAKNDLIIVFGGTLFYEKNWINKILKNDSVDIVIEGEGELTLSELIESVDKGKSLKECKGIVFKEEGKIISSDKRPLISNLDTLPFLDFKSLPIENYDDSEHIALMTSRGCILNCVFCSSREFWPGFRMMSGERIFEEVKFHKKRYPLLGHINFLDLLFNANIKSLNTFCDLMIKEKFQGLFFWTANAIIRPEMTLSLLKKMRKAGCNHLIYGIESGSQRVLDLMKKRYKVSDADSVLKATSEAGIMVTTNFMFGFPGETNGDFNQTLDFIKRNAEYIDRVYPSRTYCALEESSYLHSHLNEFDIKPNPPNHLYWESLDGNNNYHERLLRCEAFCNLANHLGIEVGCGVQTSVELDRWYNLGHYYENKKDFEKAVDFYLKYYQLDPDNAVISSRINYYSQEVEKNNSSIRISPELKERLTGLPRSVSL